MEYLQRIEVVSLQIAMDEGISEGLRGFRSC